MEYYVSIRKDEYLTFASAWMGLEEMMLSEISQGENVNYHLQNIGITWRILGEGREK